MYPAVGSDLSRKNKVYRASLIEFNSICITNGFLRIQSFVDGSDDRPVTEHSPVLLQVAQLSIQMALIRLWNSIGIVPDVVIGHSLSEYAALCASGVLSAADAIYLVGSRAKLMEMNCTIGTHAMLAIQGEDSSSDQMNLQQSDLACINSAKEFVLSAPTTEVETLKHRFESLGYRATSLAVPYAFHSLQVDAILAPFREICSKVTFRKLKSEILSATLGRPLGDSSIDPEYLCRHARQTVNFYGALCDAKSNGIITSDSVFLEIGPSPVCNSFVNPLSAPQSLPGTNAVPLQHSQVPEFILTTSVHRVVKEEFGDVDNIVNAETDLSLSAIRHLLKGHVVSHVALCPSSLHGDIGITLGAYIHNSMSPHPTTDSTPIMNVRDMAVQKTLISRGLTPHIININAKASSSRQSIQIEISSQEGQHASFVVEFCKESEYVNDWKRTGLLVESRMQALREQSQGHEVHFLH
ncbi:Thiolase-like protein [Penicillium waksmanii]|uniref:Thiolase-like protein n=1 Tax=Penicillium waksmanii TaxID=69791 RepID=UPI0025478BA4|nr:Thiolase-like protein [Penicillium waksmanii]KAJ5988464.1 Thiolase-like protein [Penicillium waksmanii]